MGSTMPQSQVCLLSLEDFCFTLMCSIIDVVLFPPMHRKYGYSVPLGKNREEDIRPGHISVVGFSPWTLYLWMEAA